MIKNIINRNNKKTQVVWERLPYAETKLSGKRKNTSKDRRSEKGY